VIVYGDIKDYAFCNYTYITNVVIKNAKSIGVSAFYLCNMLTKLTIETDQLTTINRSAFTRCDRLTSIYLAKSVTSIGSNAFYCLGSGIDVEQLDIYYEGSEEEWLNVSKAPFNKNDSSWNNGRTIYVHYNCDSSYR